jgi:phage shock protein A
MSISRRIIRLVKSDINEILDCLEDPQAILSQAIRDMEEEMCRTTALLRSCESEEDKISSFISRLEETYQDTLNSIEAAFAANNDVLAKSFVRKRLEIEKRRKYLMETLAGIRKEQSDYRARLKDQSEKVASIKEKQELFANYEKQSSTAAPFEEKWSISEEQVELAMLEERRKRSASAKAA